MAHSKKKTKAKKNNKNKINKKTKKNSKKSNFKKLKNLDTNIWKITSIAVVILVLGGIAFSLIKNTNKIDSCPYETIKVDFYVMSKCIYGLQVEDAIKPVLDKFGDCIDFNLNYISTYLGDGKFTSLQGEPETRGNIVQLCAAKYNPDKYMDMIVCQNKDSASIPENWEACARQYGLDVENIKRCYLGEEGINLLRENVKLAESVGATGSPTMFFNDERYTGGRDTLSFTRVICQKLTEHDECKSIPECASDADCEKAGKVGKCENPNTENARCVFVDFVEVDLIVLSDERCVDCETENTMAVNKNYFPGIVERYVDYGTDEGKQIYEEYNIKYLPAYIFDSSLEDTNTWKTNPNLREFFNKVDDKIILNADAIGSVFDPTREICDNGIDDTGNGLVDCEDPDCWDFIGCNPNLFADCAAEFGISADSVVFFYSDTCEFCSLMKPAIEELEKEGYSFVWADAANVDDNIMIEKCFGEHMGSGVPQFICLNKNDVKVGAFLTPDREGDTDGLREWFDNCIS